METSPGYSITARLEIADRPGTFARIASAVGQCGGNLDAVDLVATRKGLKVRDVTIECRDDTHGRQIVDALRGLDGVRLVRWHDVVFRIHLGGKISIANKMPVNTRAVLSMAYTPGVARVCRAIAAEPERAWNLTIKKNSVAVVTNGTAVLGLGDIGPAAALPVMEGKAMLFKEFGRVDAYPICLDCRDTDELVRTVKALAPQFGGINLEDIAAPQCFEVERRLKAELDIPVFHDDQHGTAVVVTAALTNALKLLDRKPEDLRIVIAGVGAAGMACARMLMDFGAGHIVGVDRAGAVYNGRTEHMNDAKQWFAEHTNQEGQRGGLDEVCRGANMFLGLAGPGLLNVGHLKSMADGPIVFALANPEPEIDPSEAEQVASVVATGRSDYPNQINNVLCFPGLFRGLLDARASDIDNAMLQAAASAIASLVDEDHLSDDYIIPSPFDRRVARNVARAVAAAAVESGLARGWETDEAFGTGEGHG